MTGPGNADRSLCHGHVLLVFMLNDKEEITRGAGKYCEKYGNLVVCETFDSRSSSLGSNPGQRHCVVFLGKTLYSDGASLSQGV